MEYGLIGEKLGHSFSKEIHEKIENYTYTICEIKKEDIGAFMLKKDFKAINVTIPYKQTVMPYLDYISESAKSIGAVNTVVNKDGKLYGYNTDCLGLKAMIKNAQISLSGKKVLILGSGGTSKTALCVAREEGADAVCVSRTKKDGYITYEEAYTLHMDTDIIINTTPCGMYPDVDSVPIDIDKFPLLCGVVDVIYNPLRTKLVSQALKKGIRASGGLYMLVAQAVFAAEKFTGKSYDNSVIENIFTNINSSKENIVLVGMPSSGKSTVGKEICDITGREFIDVDEMIEKTGNMKISDIFSKYGESAFRDMESKCVFEVSRKSGCIIATGGGAILRSENVSLLKQNGRLYFLDRNLADLKPTDDRPLALDKEAIKKRFEERYPIYKSVSDKTVIVDADAKEIAKRILYLHSEEGEV